MWKRTILPSPSKSAAARPVAIAKPKLEDYLANCDPETLDLIASFQRAMVEDLIIKTLAAARAYDVATAFRHWGRRR